MVCSLSFRNFENGRIITFLIHSGEKEKDICTGHLGRVIRNKSLGVTYSTVTEEEKNMIVKAIHLKQGHWFKCPLNCKHGNQQF